MYWLTAFNLIGTVAFAIAGALVGIRKELDLFGVVTLSVITSSFGGILRDVLLGKLPPTLFTEPEYAVVSILSAVITFYIYPTGAKLTHLRKSKFLSKSVLLVDAVGLSAFTTIGAQMAVSRDLNNLFGVICMGLITGVGGGMIRDTLVRDIPLVLRKEIYAIAAVSGAAVFYLAVNMGYTTEALYLSFLTTLTMRVVSIALNLNLPAIRTAPAAAPRIVIAD